MNVVSACNDIGELTQRSSFRMGEHLCALLCVCLQLQLCVVTVEFALGVPATVFLSQLATLV